MPKQRPIKDVNKHLRPISLTPIISKIAEEHIVETYIKPAVLDILDPQQFGAIPKSSSTQALISLLHNYFLMFRKQRTKLSNECYSEWLYVRAGVPQGT